MPRTGIKLAVRTMLGAQTSAATLRLENDVLSWKLSIADRPHPPFGEATLPRPLAGWRGR